MSALSGRVHYDPIVVRAESTVVAEFTMLEGSQVGARLLRMTS